MEEIRGRVHSTETFGSVDGPGVRFLIFLQGCELRCRYCHNVDTWNPEAGNLKTADELLDQALRYKKYWGKEGGITVSGGEPLLQMDFLLDFMKKAKALGIHTCIDTAGQPFSRKEPFFSKFRELMEYTDLLLMDIKHIDSGIHAKLVGKRNENIKDMFRYLDEIQKPIWIRHVLIPGWTDKDEYLHRTADFISTLSNVAQVDVLPYHALGSFKWEELGLAYSFGDVKSPEKDRVDNARAILGAALEESKKRFRRVG